MGQPPTMGQSSISQVPNLPKSSFNVPTMGQGSLGPIPPPIGQIPTMGMGNIPPPMGGQQAKIPYPPTEKKE